jgi:hypothetical protein
LLTRWKELGGNKWSEIARLWLISEGNNQQRTELQIKNRFKALIKKEDAS